jgi:hypothetical protein
VFAVQDEIAEAIAASPHNTFTSFSTKAIDPAAHDLYLRASPRSCAPGELRARVGLLELATQHAPDCAGDAPYDFKAGCKKYRGFPKDALPAS